MAYQRTWHFHISENAKRKHYSGWLHDFLSSWTHAGLYLASKAHPVSQSGVISEPLKVNIVSRKPAACIWGLKGPGNAIQTLASNSCSCPSVPQVNLDSLEKCREWAKQSRISSDSNRRQLVLPIYLHASGSQMPEWRVYFKNFVWWRALDLILYNKRSIAKWGKSCLRRRMICLN